VGIHVGVLRRGALSVCLGEFNCVNWGFCRVLTHKWARCSLTACEGQAINYDVQKG
jgi:hypothetical protein